MAPQCQLDKSRTLSVYAAAANIDHDAKDLASCRQERCEKPLVGECKVEFTRLYLVSKLFHCHQSLLACDRGQKGLLGY